MKFKWMAGVAILVVVVSAWWWLGKQTSSQSANNVPKSSAAVSPETKPKIEPMLRAAADELASAQTAEAKRAALLRLQQALATGTTNEISAAIRRLLDAKMEASTGQGFKLGAGGALLEAPTLRTFLLDQLAAVDPAAAAAYAREILKSSGSPDEWALALRSLARNDTSPEAIALLKEKVGELLRNEAWQKDPSVGYLEAFDTAVYLGSSSSLSPLSDLVRMKDNQAVAQAAYLALDRLTINQPAETLAALAEHPEWMTGREETRANYFARADVGDPAQRRLVEKYLLDASRGPAELQKFAGLFPNANFMISNNLLTANATPNNAALTQRDRASLDAVNAWLSDPRFANLHPLLQTMKARLEGFLK